MLDRWGVIEGSLDPMQLELVSPLPDPLADQDILDIKRKRDQEKLYALLQYVKTKEDRKGFIHRYFGLDSAGEALFFKPREARNIRKLAHSRVVFTQRSPGSQRICLGRRQNTEILF